MVICLDTETTGLTPGQDEVLQLAIITPAQIAPVFCAYTKPEHVQQWPGAQRVNGISPEMVARCMPISYYRPEIEAILQSASLIVGYNVSFDLSFLAHVVTLPHVPMFDVMLNFARVYGEKDPRRGGYKWQKLTTCAAYYGYKWPARAHDALADARATLYCYERLTAQDGN